MANTQTQPKRQRADTILEPLIIHQEKESSKRHKYSSSYNHLLSILDDDDEEEENNKPIQDLSAIFTALQQELYSPSPSSPSPPFFGASEEITNNNEVTHLYHSSTRSFVHPAYNPAQETGPGPVIGLASEATMSSNKEDNESNGDSNDELGIPSDGGGNGINGGDSPALPLSDGLWEFEDETANYYSLLHSELFM